MGRFWSPTTAARCAPCHPDWCCSSVWQNTPGEKRLRHAHTHPFHPWAHPSRVRPYSSTPLPLLVERIVTRPHAPHVHFKRGQIDGPIACLVAATIHSSVSCFAPLFSAFALYTSLLVLEPLLMSTYTRTVLCGMKTFWRSRSFSSNQNPVLLPEDLSYLTGGQRKKRKSLCHIRPPSMRPDDPCLSKKQRNLVFSRSEVTSSELALVAPIWFASLHARPVCFIFRPPSLSANPVHSFSKRPVPL
mmetsp:Transcript_2615/g.4757  ORF Transcript_2615/g.4757 Transcript_2615/m.4757 type:complete len:245 (-) Transcript_2615:207-941(-)